MKRFIALLCSLALIVSMLLALTCCVKDDGQNPPKDLDSGDQTPGGDENEGDNKDDGVIDGGNIDLGGGEDNNDPENPDNPNDPENPDDPENPNNPDDSITSDWKNDPESLTYEEFLAMTPEERIEHYYIFKELGLDYGAWRTAAEKAYEDANKPPELGEGDNIDLGGGN